MPVGQPLGRGPEVLLQEWPPVPVLLLGPADSGRRTWTDYLLRAHDARLAMTLRHDAGVTMEQARELMWWLSVRSRAPRWATINLDLTEQPAQNALLKTLEEPPEAARVLLWGQRTTVLETIRSRCRVVRLTPSPLADEIAWVEASADVTFDDAALAVAAARGRPGLALRIAGQSEAASRGQSLVQSALRSDRVALAAGMADPAANWDEIRDWLHRWASTSAATGGGSIRAIAAARDVRDPKLAVRVVLDRLVPKS